MNEDEIPGTAPDAGSTFAEHRARIRRGIEELLDRHREDDEGRRADALARLIEDALWALPDADRGRMVEALRRDYPAEDGQRVEPPAGDRVAVDRAARDRTADRTAQETATLQAEVERLRAVLADRPGTSAAPASSPDALRSALLRLLAPGLDATGIARAEARADVDERIVAVTRQLFALAAKLGRAFLAQTEDADLTMAGCIEAAVAAAATGGDPGTLDALLGDVERRICIQVAAFEEACETGAQNLLRQVAPAAVSALLAREKGSGLGRRLFRRRECWERFERRYEEVRTSDRIWADHFEGAYRLAVHRLSRPVGRSKEAG